MTVLQSSGGSLVTVGGDTQPYPRASVPFSEFGGGGVTLIGNGQTVSYAHLYRTQLWVGIAVHKLSRQIARLPLKVYRRTSAGRERVRAGKLAGLLEHPFPRGGPTHLKQAIAMSALVQGNCALRKARDAPGAPPARLEPLNWRQLRVHGVSGGAVELWESVQPGQPRWIDPEDVVHVAWRGVDGPIGVSPLSQLAVTISIEDAVQRSQQAFWRNGARPEGAITMSDKLLNVGPDERDDMLQGLREDIEDIYGGPDNSGRPALLPPGMEWQTTASNAQEAELIDQRKLTREEVAACYDAPAPLVGIHQQIGVNNIAELHRMLYVTVLGPWLNLIEETLKAQLIDPEPAYRGDVWVEFDLSEVLKGDTLQRAQALALQIGYGVLTIDEARDIENRERFGMPETTRPLYPANNLKPAGLPYQNAKADDGEDDDGAPSDGDVQAAAQAVSRMDEAQIARLLTDTGGSPVDAILNLAASASPNGAHAG